ncbi:MAG: phosphate acyltransferase PlsX [Betaproteobacteria bacterium]|jgi:glycerol-3-phosphate acyltransferase PlsX
MITLSVDLMGGDLSPEFRLEACKNFLNHHPKAHVLMVGLKDSCGSWSHARATFIECTEVVHMDDALEVAMRRKKDSSMRVCIEQVKSGAAQVAVSAGNTGALMAIARYVLKTIEGIDRPAIAGQMPNVSGGATTMLDLGANVDCTPEHLLQFAVMGSALVSVLQNKANPTVGLLNIGEEAIKGSEVIKRTSELLKAAGLAGNLNFYGNVEGNDIFKGTTDIVICDGFVGNVALKASEGLAWMVSTLLREGFARNIFTKIAAILSYPVLSGFKKRVDHRRHNGAALLGLQGLVFKSHGSADALAYETALNRAYDAVQNHLLEKVQSQISKARALLEAQVQAQTLQ